MPVSTNSVHSDYSSRRGSVSKAKRKKHSYSGAPSSGPEDWIRNMSDLRAMNLPVLRKLTILASSNDVDVSDIEDVPISTLSTADVMEKIAMVLHRIEAHMEAQRRIAETDEEKRKLKGDEEKYRARMEEILQEQQPVAKGRGAMSASAAFCDVCVVQ